MWRRLGVSWGDGDKAGEGHQLSGSAGRGHEEQGTGLLNTRVAKKGLHLGILCPGRYFNHF